MRDEEISAKLFALRDELMRQIYQFERDKVADPDDRARAAIKYLVEKQGEMSDRVGRLEENLAQLAAEVANLSTHLYELKAEMDALEARVALCEGRIARLEAKP